MSTTAPIHRLRRAAAAVAVTVVSALVLSGCLYAAIPEASDAPAPGPTAPTEVPSELEGYYDQEVSWVDCGDGFDCARVLAPLDWEDPGLEAIELSIVRHRAESGTAVGSLLTNPGGPGASGVELIRDSLGFAVSSDLQQNFDVIGFDPRGVGDSTAVTCLDAAGMDAFLFEIPEAERGTPEWEDELAGRSQTFADACEANSDGILPYITTVQSARDMDLLRAVLGDDQLFYLGYSYGTFLGATYAELYPENVGRMVLDGAIDPSIPSIDVGTTQAVGFERALRAYMASCLGGDDCPFSGSVDQAMSDLGALLASVDRSPLAAADGRFLGADALMTAIITALYSQQNWFVLTMALDAALQGDPETAFYLADFYYGREGGEYADNSTEAFTAYNCMDYPDDTTEQQEADSEARIAAEAPTIAPYWQGADICEVWPNEPTGERGAITAEGAAPIVVVGTTGDPATPYEWSVALADQLSSGVLVTFEGEGHTGYNKGGACVDSAVDAYLIDGTVPEDGACG